MDFRVFLQEPEVVFLIQEILELGMQMNKLVTRQSLRDPKSKIHM
jgi:hypothetical protein